jgi:hypothetical protein
MSPLKGIVRGQTIELEGELGLPDGQPVTVTVHSLLPPGEGIKQSAGAWADAGVELDSWLDQVQQSRRLNRSEPTL